MQVISWFYYFFKEVKKDPVMQDRTQFVLNVVRKYMEIVNTTILDMTPKYLIMSLVQDVSFD